MSLPILRPLAILEDFFLVPVPRRPRVWLERYPSESDPDPEIEDLAPQETCRPSFSEKN